MGLWAYGLMGLWAYGLMGLWAYGLMGLWAYGLMGGLEDLPRVLGRLTCTFSYS